MKRNSIFIAFLILLSSERVRGQNFFAENAGIVYSSSINDKDSLIKQKYMMICKEYIENNYRQRNIPLIYIVAGKVPDSVSSFELAYDNYMGTSVQNTDYGRNKRYDKPGIRIKAYSDRDESENFLKLLDYGIKNLKTLKRIRKSIVKKKYYDRPDTLSLSDEKIKEILNSETAYRIKATLSL